MSANVAPQVDLVTRPLYDGAMMFTAIRDAAAEESFSWTVELSDEQQLILLDPHHAEVYYADGHPAFAISAVSAHDAIGTEVPTTLSVSEGNVVTLTVAHKGQSPAGANFVYPVVAGTGWEGGFQTYQVEMPPPEPEEAFPSEEASELQDLGTGEMYFRSDAYGPPVAAESSDVPPAAVSPQNFPIKQRPYIFNECTVHPPGGTEPGKPPTPLPPKERIALDRIAQQCHGSVPGANAEYKITWALAVHGRFSYKYGHKVWIDKQPKCAEWNGVGYADYRPAEIKCFAPETVSSEHLDVLGRFRWKAGKYIGLYALGSDVCGEIDGVLPIRPIDLYSEEWVYGKKHHWSREPAEHFDGPCDWGHLQQVY